MASMGLSPGGASIGWSRFLRRRRCAESVEHSREVARLNRLENYRIKQYGCDDVQDQGASRNHDRNKGLPRENLPNTRVVRMVLSHFVELEVSSDGGSEADRARENPAEEQGQRPEYVRRSHQRTRTPEFDRLGLARLK